MKDSRHNANNVGFYDEGRQSEILATTKKQIRKLSLMLTHDMNCVLWPALPHTELRGAHGDSIKFMRKLFQLS